MKEAARAVIGKLIGRIHAQQERILELEGEKKALERDLFRARCSLERAHGERLRLMRGDGVRS